MIFKSTLAVDLLNLIKSKELKYKAKLGICCRHDGDTVTLNKIYAMVITLLFCR